jgi:superfamily II DNA or RNA helicase
MDIGMIIFYHLINARSNNKFYDFLLKMNHNSEDNKLSSTITVPRIEFKPLVRTIGLISHIIDEGGEKEIVSIEEIKISNRIKERLYILSNNQKIIITSRKKLERPAGVDGVLQTINGKSLKWLSHRLLEEFAKDIKDKGWKTVVQEISDSWTNKFYFHTEKKDENGTIVLEGLRPPQIGSLHSIGAHWSLHSNPATVVMPTGTGKTETMLASLVAYQPGKVLVIVPSKVLRDQTAKKFLTFGLLRQLGNLKVETRNPIVGIIARRPKSQDDLEIFNNCNVILSTMSALGEESSNLFSQEIANRIDALIVDEAHHIAAPEWTKFRDKFNQRKILQFTATPYRRDGKLVEGKVIYNYPLREAQRDGYFKKISFQSIFEIDPDRGDYAIAAKAIECLRKDISSGLDHLMMARCSNIIRAVAIHKIYEKIAKDLNPVIIHSEGGNTDQALNKIKSGESKIVVCVNMLGEGFDLPQLKIAAVHDTHKSLGILLQFTGRFTRSSGTAIGDATVIANIANQEVSSALERLYSEDADWNHLLSEFSSEAAKAHSELIDFLNSSERLDKPEDENIEISHHLLRPKLSTLMFEASSFQPKKFFEGISKNVQVQAVWLHNESNTLFFVARMEIPLQWTKSKKILDRQWDLFVIHFDSSRNLLFLCSSDKESNHEKLANAIGGNKQISGDIIFRCLGRINRLIFQNIGVRKHGRRNLSYALYTGSDVATALSISESSGSVKSNLSGTGWEDGRPVAIGCSYKGRIWSRNVGTIPEFVSWCGVTGDKIRDNSIDTKNIIANVLIPEEINNLPDKKVISIDWPIELIRQSEERVTLYRQNEEMPILMFGIDVIKTNVLTSKIEFYIYTEPENTWGTFELIVGGLKGFEVIQSSQSVITIKIGNLSLTLGEYFSNYPPLLRFVDLSELDGNLLIKPQGIQALKFPLDRFDIWDWNGIDINKESIWKNGNQRKDSIQWHVANHFIGEKFQIVFDDDAPGEASDLICLKEENEFIRLVLIHCKFTGGSEPGERVKDVEEVCSQAIRSAKWKWKFLDLCRHILGREKRLMKSGRSTRFLQGHPIDLNKFMKVSKSKEIKPEIIIVQPGLSSNNHTPDQVAILASTYSFLKETIGVDLKVICSI